MTKTLLPKISSSQKGDFLMLAVILAVSLSMFAVGLGYFVGHSLGWHMWIEKP